MFQASASLYIVIPDSGNHDLFVFIKIILFILAPFPHYSEFLNLLIDITKTFILNLKFLNSHESMEHYQQIYSS